uniref:Uncharacterized protein n=1 Tax=Anguilla anguilla TaxID=7936 RepID=A0A0E9S477_ANGAN
MSLSGGQWWSRTREL